MSSDLEESSNQLKASKEEWNELLQLKEQLSSDYSKISQEHHQTLDQSKTAREVIMNDLKQQQKKLSADLKKSEMEEQNELRQQELRLQRDLTSYEDKLLLPLKTKMLTEEPVCPNDLKHLVLQEDIFWLSRMPKQITDDSEKRRSSLEHQLSKLGYRNISVDELVEAANKD